ncbi:MAG TPA: surface lipoprotein assembly modifier [Blastocatellia bacterium]|nr:surface lipoprotein assembly modifier [Blastocatellia bacterium]
MKRHQSLIIALYLILLGWSTATPGKQGQAASPPTGQTNAPSGERSETQKTPSPQEKTGAQRTPSQAQEPDLSVEPPQERSVIIPQPLPAGPSRFRAEVGVLPRYNSNLFSATAGAPRQTALITTLAVKVEADLVRGEGSTMTARFAGHRNVYQGIEGADSSDFDISLEYGFGRNRLALTYFMTPRRLVYVVGDERVVNRLDGVDLRFSRRITRRTRSRVGYEFTRERFPILGERNSDRHRLSGDIRYRIHDLLAPGIGFEWGRVTANSTNYNRDEAALLLLLDSRFKNAIWASMRYRYGQRHYTTTNSTAGNFGRRDRRHEIRWQASVRTTRHWGFLLYGSYTTNASTRERRSFTGYEVGVGMVFRFP